MDTQPNFEYLCRVCAANTKGKNSVAECVYILKTPGLKDKMERFLYLSINQDDFFPKVLCKTCFRQVEATASLSNIAKHTQQVFRDFLISTMPKQVQSQPTAFNTNVCTNTVASANTCGTANHYHRNANVPNDEFRPLVLSNAPETTITLAPPTTAHAHRDEVVISLTKKKNNETRPRTKNTAIQQRRNSIFDARFLNAPVSIAQRAFLAPQAAPIVPAATLPSAAAPAAKPVSQKPMPPLTPKTAPQLPNLPAVEITPAPLKPNPNLTTSNLSTKTPSTSAGVINFIQTHGKITGSTNGSSSATATGVLNNMPSSVLQQKRRNLKMALNNIKAVNSGQVSLLKSSQNRPKQIEEPSPQTTIITVAGTSKKAFDDTVSIEECLPENIIIAAPKKKRDEAALGGGMQTSLKTTKTPSKQHQQSQQNYTKQQQQTKPPQQQQQPKPPQQQQQPKPSAPQQPKPSAPQQQQPKAQQQQPKSQQQQPKSQQQQQQPKPPLPSPAQQPKPQQQQPKSPPPPQQQQSNQSTTPLELMAKPEIINPVSSLTEGISLGSVIRDPDLLKLILKALQWPVNKTNFEDQLTCLRNSKFVDIMSDHKLLQDTDVTQLLGPYITPVLLAAQALQQQQQPTTTAATSTATTTAASTTATISSQLSSSNHQQKHNEKSQKKPLPSSPPEAAPTANSASILHDLQSAADLASTIPYKLPPETSVQLVPSSPTEQEVNVSANRETTTKVNTARSQRKIRTHESSLVISPEDSNREKTGTPPHLSINALLMSQFAPSLASATDANLALYALMQKQQQQQQPQTSKAVSAAEKRQRRRRRSSSSPGGSNAGINLEDIVLVEPQPALLQPPCNEEYTASSTAAKPLTPADVVLAAFKRPAQEPPIITRPIIKRRKTVIQSTAKPRVDAGLECHAPKENVAIAVASTFVAKSASTAATTPSTITVDKPTQPETPQLPTSTTSVIVTEPQKAPFNPPATQPTVKIAQDIETLANETVPPTITTPTPKLTPTVTLTLATTNKTTPTATTTSSSGKPNITTSTPATSKSSTIESKPQELATNKPAATRKSGISKSALGKQLLQAIGLEKLGVEGASGGQALAEHSRDTLRSALKRSLKQAQEKQMGRTKQAEPVKQVAADSTTKSTARESIDEYKEQTPDKPNDLEQGKRIRRAELKLEDDELKLTIKTERAEQPNVSSSDMTPRRRGRKRKDERELEVKKIEDDTSSLNDEKTSERWDDDDDLPLKLEKERSVSRSSSRPARTSKTLSKYYKGPDKSSPKSSHVPGTRVTRSRT